MSASITRGDAVKIARNLGAAGRPLPAEMATDPGLVAAHDQGSADHGRAAGFHPPRPIPARPAAAPTTPPAPVRVPSPAPAATRTPPASAPAKGPGLAARADKVAGAIGSPSSGGTGGGLLLVVVLWPLVLATFKYGPSGPGMWFRAKWLNQPTAATSTGVGTVLNNATNPAAAKAAQGGSVNGEPPGTVGGGILIGVQP